MRINAQQKSYIFQHLTTKEGLASDLTKFIFQDSKGFYWLGYDNGFQKFEGKFFTNVSFNNTYIRSGLLDGPVVKPVEDNTGHIYIMNQGSVYVYNPGGSVDTVQVFGKIADTFSDISSFCKDKRNTIWMVSGRGIFKYEKDRHKPVLWLATPQKSINGSLCTILYDSLKECFWLAQDAEIFRIDINSKKISRPFFSPLPGKNDLPANRSFTGFWMDTHQNLWIGAWNGNIYKYNTVNFHKEKYDEFNVGKDKYQTDKSIPICFLEDSNKQIWIGCNNGGLYFYDEPGNHMHSILSNNNLPASLHYNYGITFLDEDREGNIWVGTDRGINIFNPAFQPFHIVDENSALSLFQKLEVTSLFETRAGNILVGTWGKGWFMYDKNFKLLKQFYDNSASKEKKGAFRKNLVWCFAEDLDNNILIGYQNGLLGLFNPVTGKLKYEEIPEFKNKTITAMQMDSHGNGWFGLHSGFLAKWEAALHAFSIFKFYLPFPNPPAAITDIKIDKHNQVWVATNGNGFYSFDPVTEKISGPFIDKEKNAYFDNFINSLTLLDDSIIGVATTYKGFFLFNRKTKKATGFTMQNGLPANNIFGMAKDRQGSIWLAASNGLCKRNKNGKNFASFQEEDGLLLKHFNGKIVSLTDGKMVIPAETGFVYFDPGKITGMSSPPEVNITGFTIFDKPLAIDSLISTNPSIVLEHDQNFITISFASLSFSGRNATQYFYKLTGIDKDWVKNGTKRLASYTNLSPGHYTFKVRCLNREGISSKNITLIPIYIQPPWWFTWWAYLLYSLIIALLVFVLYRNRIHKLKQVQAGQVKLMIATQEEERKRISRDLHDDVGTKLSALKLFLSTLREKAMKTGEKEMQLLAFQSEKYITETLKDIRQLLLNLSPAVLEEFGYTTAVEGLVNKINETKQIYFDLVFFGMKHRLKTDYELALYRITQELINNVLKHAEAKNVALQIGQRDEKIILMIEDDGKGFEVKEHLEGYGLHNLEARTKMMNGVMTIDSQTGKGTTVLIEIPYGKRAYHGLRR